MTLDGFVGRPNGATDWMWIGKPDPAGLQKVIELAESCDTILLGRKMTPDFVKHWEGVADNHPDSHEQPLAHLMVNMRKIVFTRTKINIKGRNLEVENGDLVTAVNTLKQQPGKDIVVYGGADFVNSLVDNNLIDEYNLITNPVVIGNGLRIFKDQKVFQLADTVIFTNGKIWNKYLPV